MLVRNICALLFPGNQPTVPLRTIYQPRTSGTITYLLPYAHPTVSHKIKQAKYERNRTATVELGNILHTYVTSLDDTPVHLLPIPQHYHRWRERGFHHLTEIITHGQLSSLVRLDVLHKQTHTKRQAHVTRDTRLHQQAGSFTCDHTAAGQLSGTVVLFDDVCTTGATMTAAAAALQPHLPPGTRLLCVTLAH